MKAFFIKHKNEVAFSCDINHMSDLVFRVALEDAVVPSYKGVAVSFSSCGIQINDALLSSPPPEHIFHPGNVGPAGMIVRADGTAFEVNITNLGIRGVPLDLNRITTYVRGSNVGIAERAMFAAQETTSLTKALALLRTTDAFDYNYQVMPFDKFKERIAAAL